MPEPPRGATGILTPSDSAALANSVRLAEGPVARNAESPAGWRRCMVSSAMVY